MPDRSPSWDAALDRVTAHLRDLGLDVFGVDLSPVMIDLAREAYPDLRFEVGSMDTLDLAEGKLNGIVTWYSVIHTPPQNMPSYFAEFRRVLAPGGHLLIAFFESCRQVRIFPCAEQPLADQPCVESPMVTDDWRQDRIGSALRGANPTVLQGLEAGSR